MNMENITLAEAEKLPFVLDKEGKPIDYFKNNWRRRLVHLRQHPKDSNLVVSVGYPYGGGKPTVCTEHRSEWRRTITEGARHYD